MTLAFVLYSIALLLFILSTQMKVHGSGEADWKNLANTMYAVYMDGLVSLLHGDKRDRPLSRSMVKTFFSNMGGREGLERMQHNSRILVKIARSVNERSQGACFGEITHLQQEVLRLKVYASFLKLLLRLRYFGPCTLVSIKEVAGAYQRAVELVLNLHEIHAPQRKARMIAACNWQLP